MNLRILVGLVIVLVFGCAKSTTETGDGVLDILAYGNTSSPDGIATRKVMEAYIAEKGLTEDQYTIEYLYDEAYHQKAQARLLSDDVPDVMYAWASERASYLYLSGQAVDLDTVLDTSKLKDAVKVVNSPMDGVDAGFYVLPLSLGVNSVLYANKAILSELGVGEPQTYEELLAIKAPAEAAGYTLVAMANADQWVMNSTLFGTLIARTSGDPNWLRKAAQGEYKFTDKPMVDALAMVEKMYSDGVLTKANVQTDYGTSLSQFVSGKAVFTIDGHWRIGGMEDPNFVANVDMLAFPTIPGDKLPGAVAGEPTPGYTVTKTALEDGKVKDLAVGLLEYMMSPAGAKVFQEEASLIPATTETVDAKVSPQLALKIKFYDSVKVLANTPDQVMDTATTNALNNGLQEIGLGVKTAQEVADAIEAAAAR